MKPGSRSPLGVTYQGGFWGIVYGPFHGDFGGVDELADCSWSYFDREPDTEPTPDAEAKVRSLVQRASLNAKVSDEQTLGIYVYLATRKGSAEVKKAEARAHLGCSNSALSRLIKNARAQGWVKEKHHFLSATPAMQQAWSKLSIEARETLARALGQDP